MLNYLDCGSSTAQQVSARTAEQVSAKIRAKVQPAKCPNSSAGRDAGAPRLFGILKPSALAERNAAYPPLNPIKTRSKPDEGRSRSAFIGLVSCLNSDWRRRSPGGTGKNGNQIDHRLTECAYGRLRRQLVACFVNKLSTRRGCMLRWLQMSNIEFAFRCW
jgi:hypothetical protein